MRIIYIHHPDHHPAHASYAKAVGAFFIPEDHYFQYVGKNKWARLRRYISLLLLCFRFPYGKYDAIITDEPQLYGSLLKKISLGRIKLIATQASITPNRYFDNKLPPLGAWAFKKICNTYDLIIAIGNKQYELMRRICDKNPKVQIECSFNGIADKIVHIRNRVKYNPYSLNLIAISNIPTKEILYVKGWDIAIQQFLLLKEKYPLYKLLLVGNVKDTIQHELEKMYACSENGIVFVGGQSQFEDIFNDALCLLQLSRMDAWGLAANEAMYNGIPAFISAEAGASAIYKGNIQADNFVIDLAEKGSVLSKWSRFLDLPAEEKETISKDISILASGYTESAASERYKEILMRFLAAGI